MSDYHFFKIEISDYIAHVAFNRPEKSNALNREAWIEMKALFENLSDDPKVRVIVLSGEGKNFCAGIDLSLLMDVSAYNEVSCEGRKRELVRKFILDLQASISAIELCKKPVIGAIHRACIGGAVDIIAACDMRFCTDDTYFSIKEVDMGLVADIGTMQRLPQIIQPGIMAELAYTGRNLLGPEAKEIGLCNQSFKDKESMMTHILQLAQTIAEKSPLVIRGSKEIMRYTRDHSVEESLEYMALYNAAFLLTDDLAAAFQAQMTKQKPVFKD